MHTMKIPLPTITSLPNSSAHDYPFQIGYRAQKFIAGAIFYYAFVDMAVGQYVRQDAQAVERIQAAFREKGLSTQSWEKNWSCFEYYLNAFPSPVFQNALFSMIMHWDWYISRLGSFVEFARAYVQGPPLDTKDEKVLQNIGFKGIAQQIDILSKATGLNFNFEPEVIASATEMDLVRNLGTHNQWEVDHRYLHRSLVKKWALGDVREITSQELGEWRDSLGSIILETATAIAKLYNDAPTYLGNENSRGT